MLISTLPDTRGKAAVLARSRQLTEFAWIPVKNMPTYLRDVGITVLPEGQPQRGMPYASTEYNDKFICENLSFHTILSAMGNPDSALYNKTLPGRNSAHTYMGIVCNGLVRYALGIRRRFSTMRWASVPGMRLVKPEGQYTAEEIQLCDVLHAYGNGRSHVSLITDIIRDSESGEIVYIEVSEAVRPTCKRRRFTPEEYFEKFKLFGLWRYDYVDDVPDPDPAFDRELFEIGVPTDMSVAVDLGDRSNYLTREEVVISAFCEGENHLELCRDGELVEEIVIEGRGKVSRHFDTRGYYTVRHKTTGEVTEFAVMRAALSHTVGDGVLTVEFDSCDKESEVLYADFRMYGEGCASLSAVVELSDEEKKAGRYSAPIPDDAENFKVYFENRYGIWTQPMTKLREKA